MSSVRLSLPSSLANAPTFRATDTTDSGMRGTPASHEDTVLPPQGFTRQSYVPALQISQPTKKKIVRMFPAAMYGGVVATAFANFGCMFMMGFLSQIFRCPIHKNGSDSVYNANQCHDLENISSRLNYIIGAAAIAGACWGASRVWIVDGTKRLMQEALSLSAQACLLALFISSTCVLLSDIAMWLANIQDQKTAMHGRAGVAGLSAFMAFTVIVGDLLDETRGQAPQPETTEV